MRRSSQKRRTTLREKGSVPVREVPKTKKQQATDPAKIETAVRTILEAIGEDPEREGVKNTPRRVAELYRRIFGGIGKDPAKDLKLYTVENQDGLILVKDILFHSMCEHHLLPFFGRVQLAYLPDENRITGLSSLTKVVETLSRKPQLQERLTNEIADVLTKALRPRGLLVAVEAEHLCMAMNETNRSGTKTVSYAMRGVMAEEPVKAEVMSLLGDPDPQARSNTVARDPDHL
ncbi:MAG: GTP cyclohydrolase I FolE [Candidatus Eiseniibacteriota bacterium]|nr:MAG: GTP cyclohydrolase I FolE [Candidatus Eisenbacteria bacterium]